MPTQDCERLLADVEAFCQEIRPIEELCYVEHRFNDQVFRWRKVQHPGHARAGRVRRPRLPTPSPTPGPGPHRPRGHRRAHLLLRPHLHRRVPDPDLGQRGAEAPLPAGRRRGEKILAFGLTEPDAGSNPLEMQMTYERKGDHYVLNGVKYLISNGGIADAIVTFAYPNEGRTGRISAFIVDTRRPGFAREDLTAKMGMPTANTAMFEMTDCEVPAANLLGEEGDGFRIAMGTLVSGRLSVAAGCLGVIEDCLAEARPLRQGAPAARQADRQAPARAGAHRRHRDAPAGDGVAGAAGRRGEGRQRRHAGTDAAGKARPTCWRPRRSCSPPTPPGTPPTGPCRSSAAAAGPRSTAPAGTCRTCASAASTRGPTRS